MKTQTLHSSICVSCRTKTYATAIECPSCGGREFVCPGCTPEEYATLIADTDA